MLATHVYDASTTFALDTPCPCFQLDLNDLERIEKMKKVDFFDGPHGQRLRHEFGLGRQSRKSDGDAFARF